MSRTTMFLTKNESLILWYNMKMKPGVYQHKQLPERYYLYIGLARNHDTNEEVIVYVPLFTKPEWAGTARMAFRTVGDFDENFDWVGERLPDQV